MNLKSPLPIIFLCCKKYSISIPTVTDTFSREKCLIWYFPLKQSRVLLIKARSLRSFIDLPIMHLIEIQFTIITHNTYNLYTKLSRKFCWNFHHWLKKSCLAETTTINRSTEKSAVLDLSLKFRCLIGYFHCKISVLVINFIFTIVARIQTKHFYEQLSVWTSLNRI